jgi:drug/metabolite transporter (DMT)-like permease
MISKYRNHAIWQSTCAIGLTVLFIVLVVKGRQHGMMSDNLGVLCLIIYVAAWVMWMVTSFTLTRAKGYVRDFAGTLFLLFFILGICIPIAPLLFPFYIIFALEDKTKDRKRRR